MLFVPQCHNPKPLMLPGPICTQVRWQSTVTNFALERNISAGSPESGVAFPVFCVPYWICRIYRTAVHRVEQFLYSKNSKVLRCEMLLLLWCVQSGANVQKLHAMAMWLFCS